MSLDCGRKSEYPEKTHTGTRRTCKLCWWDWTQNRLVLLPYFLTNNINRMQTKEQLNHGCHYLNPATLPYDNFTSWRGPEYYVTYYVVILCCKEHTSGVLQFSGKIRVHFLAAFEGFFEMGQTFLTHCEVERSSGFQRIQHWTGFVSAVSTRGHCLTSLMCCMLLSFKQCPCYSG